MKNTISTSLIAALLLLGPVAVHQAAAQARPQPSGAAAPAAAAASPAKKLTRAELDALLAQPDKVLLLDVRRPDELMSISGFPAFLSIQAADLEKQLRVIPRDRQIVTVSNHASRASKAADLLAKNGFNVAGAVGAQDYESEGGTLVKIAAPQPNTAQAQQGTSGQTAAPSAAH
jgi:rhodanese-related sulfurtransferase